MNEFIKKNIKIILLVSILVKITGLFYRFLSVRILSIDALTTISLINPILGLCLCLSSLSIPTIINQRVSKSLSHNTYSNRSLMINAIKLTLIATSIISISLLIFAKPLSIYIYKSTTLYKKIILVIPLIYFSNISGVLRGYFEAHSLFKTTSFSSLLEQLTKIFILLIIFYQFSTLSDSTLITIIILTLTLAELVALLYLILKLKKITKLNYKKEEKKHQIIKQATPLTLVNLVSSISLFLQPIIFTYSLSKINYSSQDGLRYYAIIQNYALPLLLMAFFVTTGIIKAYFPMFCTYASNIKKTENLLNKSIFLSSIFSIIIFNINFFHPKLLLDLFFNNTLATNLVKELSVFFFIMFINTILISLIKDNNLENDLLKNNIVSCLLGIIAIFIFCQIPIINKRGYLIGMILSNFTNLLLNFFVITTKLKYKINLKMTLIIILITLINLLISFYLLIFLNNVLVLFISNIITILIYYISDKSLNFITDK